jgi:diguanylate cyclase (GGDEF)-like protein/PAS domain S-box-containing protein
MEDEYKTKDEPIANPERPLRKIDDPERVGNARSDIENALRESEERFTNLMEHIPGISIQGYTVSGEVVYWNRASEKVYGYTASEAIGKNLGDLIVPDDLKPLFREGLRLAKEIRESGEFMPPGQMLLLHKEGFLVPGYSIHTAVYKKGKEPMLFCIDFDLSERFKMEEALRASQARLQHLLTAASVLIYSSRAQTDRPESAMQPINFISDSVRQMLDYEPEEVLKDPSFWFDHLHPDDKPIILSSVPFLFRQGQNVMEYRFRHKDGSWRWLRDEMRLTFDAGGEPDEIIGSCFDITKRKEMEEELRLLSVTDQLTGLYNRRGFIALADQQLKLSARTRRAILLFFVDLDDLKGINDRFGHEEGDRALIETAYILKETFRETDIIARMGGDEFAILTIDSPGISSDSLTSRMQNRIDTHNADKRRPYTISMSMGIASCDPERNCTLDELMSSADQQMYERKKRKNS